MRLIGSFGSGFERQPGEIVYEESGQRDHNNRDERYKYQLRPFPKLRGLGATRNNARPSSSSLNHAGIIALPSLAIYLLPA